MNKRALVVLTSCFLTIFTSYATRYGYGILLPEMLSPLAITKTEAGVIYASFFIAYTVLSPVVGLLGDRYDARVIISSFVVVLGAGTFLMAYVSSLAQAGIFFALAGGGSSACWAPVMAVAQRWTSDKNRGKTLAFIDIGSAISIIVVSTAVPAIVVAHSWQTGWMSLGILGLAIAAIDLFTIRNPTADEAEPRLAGLSPAIIESIGGTYAGLLHDTKFWFIGLSYMLTGFAIIIPFTFLSTFAVQEMAFTYEAAARLMTVIGIGAIFGKLALGTLSDKVGRIKVLLLCVALVVVGTLGMSSGRRIIVITLTAIFSLGYGTLWALYAALASDYFSREYAGSTVGLWTVFLGIGSLIAPVIAGWVADTTGTLGWSFVLAGAAAIASFGLLVPVWKIRSKKSLTDNAEMKPDRK
jgi:OFA family oxalate/formate antiporter-like MFS transporter